MVEVVAALIFQGDRFLICQRPVHKKRGLKWEYVGGKVEPGETKEEALIRECREELDITVSVGDVFMDVVHEYPDILIHLTLFRASIAEGEPVLLEHNDLKWITPEEIGDFEFCPADADINARILQEYREGTLYPENESIRKAAKGSGFRTFLQKTGEFFRNLNPCKLSDRHLNMLLIEGITALLMVLLVLCFFKKPEKKVQESAAESTPVQTEEVTTESVPEETKETQESTAETSESETPEESSTAETSGEFRLQDGYSVLMADYQEVADYSWQDLYTVLLGILRTTPLEAGEEPIFCLPRGMITDTPLYITGVRRADGTEDITVAICEEEKYYVMLSHQGILQIDVKNSAFYDEANGIVYQYAPHVMLAYSASSVDRSVYDFQPIPYRVIGAEERIIVEEIENYVTGGNEE